MKHRYLYRYEDINGVGPYLEDSPLENCLSEKHVQSGKHPDISTDLKERGDRIAAFYCGCNSINNLKKWFWGFNKKLLISGYYLMKYKVKSYKIGKSKKQVFFKQKDVIWAKDVS